MKKQGEKILKRTALSALVLAGLTAVGPSISDDYSFGYTTAAAADKVTSIEAGDAKVSADANYGAALEYGDARVEATKGSMGMPNSGKDIVKLKVDTGRGISNAVEVSKDDVTFTQTDNGATGKTTTTIKGGTITATKTERGYDKWGLPKDVEKSTTIDGDEITTGTITAENIKTADGTDLNNAVTYDSDAKDKITMKGAKGTKITNLKDGVLSETSTDAVTGKQLYTEQEARNTAISEAKSDLTGTGIKTSDGATTVTNKLGSQVSITGDAKNVSSTLSQDEAGNTTVKVSMSDNPNFTTVTTTGDVNVGGNFNAENDKSHIKMDHKGVELQHQVDDNEGILADHTYSTVKADKNGAALEYGNAHVEATKGSTGANKGKDIVKLKVDTGRGISNAVEVSKDDVTFTQTDNGATGKTTTTIKGGTITATKTERGYDKWGFPKDVEKSTTIDGDEITTGTINAKSIKTADGTDLKNAVTYDSDAKDTITLAGKNGTTITNLKDGTLSETSTDAVTGKQLYAEQEARNTAISEAKSALTDTGIKTSDGATTVTNKLGSQVSITGDSKNISSKLSQDEAGNTTVKVSMSDNPSFKTVTTTGDVNVGGNFNAENDKSHIKMDYEGVELQHQVDDNEGILADHTYSTVKADKDGAALEYGNAHVEATKGSTGANKGKDIVKLKVDTGSGISNAVEVSKDDVTFTQTDNGATGKTTTTIKGGTITATKTERGYDKWGFSKDVEKSTTIDGDEITTGTITAENIKIADGTDLNKAVKDNAKDIGTHSTGENATTPTYINKEDTVKGNLEALDTGLANEQTARENADKDLGERIDTNTQGVADNKKAIETNIQDIKNNTTALSKEIADRTASDAKLQKQIADNRSSITDLYGRYSNLKTDINKVGARSAALAGLHPLDFDPGNKLNFAVSSGSFRGENSVALGAFYYPNPDIMLSAASTMGDNDNAYTFGLSFRVGPSTAEAKSQKMDTQAIYDMVGDLQKQLATQNEKIAAQEAEIEELKAKAAAK